jgi:hypothetical protein
LCSIGLICLWSVGCGQPTISGDAYQVARALHAVVHERNAAALPRAEAYVVTAAREGRITADESDLFQSHLADARAGEWDTAAADLLDLLAAQNSEL